MRAFSCCIYFSFILTLQFHNKDNYVHNGIQKRNIRQKSVQVHTVLEALEIGSTIEAVA